MFKQHNPYNHNKKGRKNYNMSPTDKNIAKSFYSNSYYNINEEKARKLISRAKEREKSEKYLALSKKEVPGSHQEEGHQESQNMQIQEYHQRPFTTAHGKRSLIGSNSNVYDSNSRGGVHKQRVSGLRNQAYSTEKTKNMRIKSGISVSDKLASVASYGGKKNSHHPVYHENDVKELRIVDYFTNVNRLDRYIKKSKERFKKGNRAFLQPSKVKASMIEPYKKSLLNVQEIFDFVQKQEGQDQSKSQEDNEAMIIEDRAVPFKTRKMDEKQKWKVVMDYMRKNPRTLVDALPDPDYNVNQTMYHPAYDNIIDQENRNINNSHKEPYTRINQDALTLNSQNKDSFDEDENSNNMKIVQGSNDDHFTNSDHQENVSQNQMAFANIQRDITQ
jgi:hypothetical protein